MCLALVIGLHVLENQSLCALAQYVTHLTDKSVCDRSVFDRLCPQRARTDILVSVCTCTLLLVEQE